MYKRPERLRLDDDGCKRAAKMIADAAPKFVPDVIARPQTDPRVRRYLREWLAAREAKAA